MDNKAKNQNTYTLTHTKVAVAAATTSKIGTMTLLQVKKIAD